MTYRNTPPCFRQNIIRGLLLVFGVIVYLIAMPGRSYAQAPCAQALIDATEYYYDARFDDAIQLLKECLEQGVFSQAEQFQVYTLLSLACFANRQEADARQAIQILLSLHPDYQPDPVRVQPSYRALVDDVRRERAPLVQPTTSSRANTSSLAITEARAPQRHRGLNKWLYFGGGAILTSAAILLLSSGRKSNPPPGQGSPPPGQGSPPPGR